MPTENTNAVRKPTPAWLWEPLWFTIESWKYMNAKHHLWRFVRGYPRALVGFMRKDSGGA